LKLRSMLSAYTPTPRIALSAMTRSTVIDVGLSDEVALPPHGDAPYLQAGVGQYAQRIGDPARDYRHVLVADGQDHRVADADDRRPR
jgi:hypothetical protein